MSALDGIGNTPLVELGRIVPPGAARLLLKLEWANPTGSMKDRMARAAIEAAEGDGRLRPGGTVVEYTAGTTGISLAFSRSSSPTRSARRSGGRWRRSARTSPTCAARTSRSTRR
jgi:cysteine synthase